MSEELVQQVRLMLLADDSVESYYTCYVPAEYAFVGKEIRLESVRPSFTWKVIEVYREPIAPRDVTTVKVTHYFGMRLK